MSALPILEAHMSVLGDNLIDYHHQIDAERKTSKGGAVRPLKGNVSWV